MIATRTFAYQGTRGSRQARYRAYVSAFRLPARAFHRWSRLGVDTVSVYSTVCRTASKRLSILTGFLNPILAPSILTTSVLSPLPSLPLIVRTTTFTRSPN